MFAGVAGVVVFDTTRTFRTGLVATQQRLILDKTAFQLEAPVLEEA